MTNEAKHQETLQVARGMHDILPERADRHVEIESAARKAFDVFRYREIRTPVLESAALFQRAIGVATDIVEKEMFTLKDRGDRVLCLRPEGTAGVVRAYIENNLAHTIAESKFFYIGPMFRAERPQKGRYREFVQIGAEFFGNARPSADAEVIALLFSLIQNAGIRELQVFINSIGCRECRVKYTQSLVEYFSGKKAELCENCTRRLEKNPLRLLDCKWDAVKFTDAPKTIDALCAACAEHYARVKSGLNAMSVPFIEQPRLVRGLDYYTRTVFEIYPSSTMGSQDALAAGGRYDNLVEQLGGAPTPAVGFAMGMERILNQLDLSASSAPAGRRGVFILPLGDAAFETTQKLLHTLRLAGVQAETGMPDQSIKSQMRFADKLGSEFCVIIGDNELKSGEYALKNLETQKQQGISKDAIVQFLQDHYSQKSS